MNIKRYTLPVVIAAAFHGSLFIGSILTSTGATFVAPAKAKPKKIIEVPIDPVVAPPEEKVETIEAVKPLARDGTELPNLKDNTATDSESLFVKPEIDSSPIKVDTSDVTKISERGVPGGGGDWNRTISGPKSFDIGSLDRTPNARVQPAPDYPAILKNQGVTGSVVVEFEVNVRGQVVRASAVRYTHNEFVEPALRAVRNWRFEPGKRNGVQVPFRMMIPIEFGLEN